MLYSPASLFHIAQLCAGLDIWIPDDDVFESDRLNLHTSVRPGYAVLLRPVLVDEVREFEYVDGSTLLEKPRGPSLRLICVIELRKSIYMQRFGWGANVGVQQRLERQCFGRGCVLDVQVRAELVLGKRYNIGELDVVFRQGGIWFIRCMYAPSTEAITSLRSKHSLSLTATPASLSITVFLSHAHVALRAYPCWGNLECSGFVGAPKNGNTTGIPPLTGLLPSTKAFEETKRRSSGAMSPSTWDFQEMTVAP